MPRPRLGTTNSAQPKKRRESGSKRKSDCESKDGHPSKRGRYAAALTVVVGDEDDKLKFSVHKDPLCSSSEYFKVACSACWREGRPEVIEVSHISPQIFEVYLHYVYTGELDIDAAGLADQSPAEGTPAFRKHLGRGLVNLYIAADVLMDQKLKNTIIDETYSGMRRLLVEYRAIAGSTVQFFEEGYGSLPKSFLAQLGLVQNKVLRELRTSDGGCGYPKPTFERRKKFYDGDQKEVDNDYYVLELDETNGSPAAQET
ncbi:hypothetical protein EJ03DRAFT_347243 [Teratosphaeria nubilosa]|uniref:BTB domain-containing protein n=1 Tax=Teratosphaeria nubilosa TaxID=161662 RepID=A0A6G1LLQ7_9PEZI|nr:hypothetical protein EJ03DRAFT_347243 [Teratosphaeria nubilosa]